VTAALHRMLWRWHFYAALFVLPFVLALAITGAVYLFRPQLDRWEERAWLGLGTAGAVSPDRQLAAALASEPGATFASYRLPRAPGDAALIRVTTRAGDREVAVSPQGRVLGALDPEARIAAVAGRIHGTLLLGAPGGWLVELAASWTILLILTGLALWWPHPFRAAGFFWPRVSLRSRALLRDLHRVIGVWIAGLMLVMLASGLPWAGAWGSAFAFVRAELGWVDGPQPWTIGVQHHHSDMGPAAATGGLPLSVFVAKAQAERMAFPVLVRRTPEGWTVKSEAQNRRLTAQVTYDARTGSEIARRSFADGHVLDRLVSTGVAWHEGQLFGWVNQLIGLLTALALVAVSVLGLLMWWRRKPDGRLGAPPRLQAAPRWPLAVLALLGLLMPLFGVSLLVVALVDRLVAKRR
jgi:uncharacterized iron-regulated membrane protein